MVELGGLYLEEIVVVKDDIAMQIDEMAVKSHGKDSRQIQACSWAAFETASNSEENSEEKDSHPDGPCRSATFEMARPADVKAV